MSIHLKDLSRRRKTYTFEVKTFILDLYINKGYSKKHIL